MTGTRVLYISDSIGLGHVRRDLAIARELRLPMCMHHCMMMCMHHCMMPMG